MGSVSRCLSQSVYRTFAVQAGDSKLSEEARRLENRKFGSQVKWKSHQLRSSTMACYGSNNTAASINQAYLAKFKTHILELAPSTQSDLLG